MAKKQNKTNYYYEQFLNLFKYAIEAADYLEKVVISFDGGIKETQIDEMHKIEHGADMCLHDTLAKLAKEFITPIEREDLLNIIKAIDDVTDNLEEIVIEMYLHNVTKLDDCLVEFAGVIKKICAGLNEVLIEFPEFKKSDKLHDLIMNVLSIEEEGDVLYKKSVRNLFVTCDDPKQLYVMENLIFSFEKCCDAVEDVAQIIDEAVMKNS